MTILTIGYEDFKNSEALALVIDKLDSVLIDVRGKPQSRKGGFSKAPLKALLGDGYEWRGDRLGNHGGNKTTPEGIAELYNDFGDVESGANGTIMCLEGNPLACHRWLISLDIERTVRSEDPDWPSELLFCHHVIYAPAVKDQPEEIGVVVYASNGISDAMKPEDLITVSIDEYVAAQAHESGVYAGLTELLLSRAGIAPTG